MDLFFEILKWAFLAGGSFFIIVASIGLLRLPDFYTRVHAGGITDTLGAALILFGLMVHSIFNTTPIDWSVPIRLFLIFVFLGFTSPTSCHALAKAAFLRGLEPWSKNK